MIAFAATIGADTSMVAGVLEIHKSNLSRWTRQSDDIAVMCALGQGHRHRLAFQSARYRDQEEKLYLMFYNRRFYCTKGIELEIVGCERS
jgi:hypothetical protein